MAKTARFVAVVPVDALPEFEVLLRNTPELIDAIETMVICPGDELLGFSPPVPVQDHGDQQKH